MNDLLYSEDLMIKYVLFLMLLYTGSAKSQAMPADSIISQVSLQQSLFFLSQDSLKGRLTGGFGANLAATFIAAKFDSAGLDPMPGNDGFYDHFIADFEGKKIPAKNVVGSIPGKITNDTVVIFSAHYDHIGERGDLPFSKDDNNYKDDIFNGANDNATGVAALLELAKYYKSVNANRYRLLFIAFSGEELGLLGSGHFTEKIKPGVIKALINLEMLGRPVSNHCFIVSFRTAIIRNNLNIYLKKYQKKGEKNFFEDDPYPDEDLPHRSDHYPFARKIKNAFTIMGSSPQDIYYHSVDDEYETIDFDFLLKAVKNIASACEGFIR